MLFQNTTTQKKKAHFIPWEHRIFLVTVYWCEGTLVTWQNLKLVDNVPAEQNTMVFYKLLLKLFTDLEYSLPCTKAQDLGMVLACLPVQSKMQLSFPSSRAGNTNRNVPIFIYRKHQITRNPPNAFPVFIFNQDEYFQGKSCCTAKLDVETFK